MTFTSLWIFFISEISKTVDMYLFLFDDILLLTKVKKHPRKVKHLMWFLHKDKFYWKHLLNELLKNRYRESNATCFSCALNVSMRPFEICLKQQEHCIIQFYSVIKLISFISTNHLPAAENVAGWSQSSHITQTSNWRSSVRRSPTTHSAGPLYDTWRQTPRYVIRCVQRGCASQLFYIFLTS